MCFNQVLFIGPAFAMPRDAGSAPAAENGEGVDHVISDYAKHIRPFKYVGCIRQEGSILRRLFLFLIGFSKMFYTLLIDQEVRVVHILDEVKLQTRNNAFQRFLLDGLIEKILLCILARILFKKKLVYHMNSDDFEQYFLSRNRLGQNVIKWLLCRMDMLLCPCESDLAFFKSHFSCKLVFIVPEGIELVEDTAGSFIDGDLIKFLYWGDQSLSEVQPSGGKTDAWNEAQNYSEQTLKGILDLMERNRSVYQGKVVLLIGGIQNGVEAFADSGNHDNTPGKESKALRDKGLQFSGCISRLIRQKHLEELVTYVDCSKPGLKARLFKTANVCLLPAVERRDNTSFLEALNFGLPIIAPYRGRRGDMVLNGINGFLIQPEDRKGMQKAIQHFFLHPTDTKVMGAASKEIVQKFDIQKVLIKLKFIYSNLLN
ncbi:Glycosyl transferases group 1 [Arachidicoccus rhizosphaerae]|uniref:Glycosyl transferases group 1 n=1 Tax=Arachidicoccus rhizosphaerae TaxID=551991 RepID=A0A1H4AE44_9BACT|nr:glycosyltransferase [Arachidicoccus rhizosphaerae]SEA33991.1 Glycosyl transferases group 1 [Arachidicoccus rhizosphaerae]